MRLALLVLALALALPGAAGLSASDSSRPVLKLTVTGSGHVISGPAAISCPKSCRATFVSGTRVRLVATPAAGWTFSKWTGACSGRGICSLTLKRAGGVGVLFVHPQTPSPTTTAATPTTTAPAPPPPRAALAGRYCGFTSNGVGFCFNVSPGGLSFGNAHFGINTECDPSSEFTITFDTTDTSPITNLMFDYEVASGEDAGSFLKGTLDPAGTASGTVHIKSSFDFEGTHYNCLFDTDWTAKIQ
jgi:hypothetical protein